MFQTLAYYSVVLHRDFAAYTAERLQEVGLNFGRLFFVLYVGKHPDCTPSELTHALHMDWGHTQRTLEKMEEDGFLTRTKEEHGRSWHLRLTEKGEEAFDVSHQVFYDWDEKMMENLDSQEKEQLFSLLEKVRKKKDPKKCMK